MMDGFTGGRSVQLKVVLLEVPFFIEKPLAL